ncbi:hypothetical protein CDD83_5303 [Cordyceps sp. RAO-2017]|nr:hypothetical protein CDD83_5303 [Cordyceps sp. RAO-2017]
MPIHEKTSVFIGREIMVNRDEVEGIDPIVDMDVADGIHANAGHDAGSPDGEDQTEAGSPDDGKARQEVSQQAGEGGKKEGQAVGQRGGGRSRGGKAKGGKAKEKKQESGRRRRRSDRIRSVAAQPKPAPSPTAPRTKSRRTAGKTVAGGKAGKEWEIERIIDSRIEAGTLRHFYLVKWKGFEAKQNTWEPKSNLTNCAAAIAAYEKKMGRG